ncbi:MAG TPA: pitrilysin family protein [Vicinamibacterales bacterium]|nr:pitrilysin family protein [Vicinamibacterales bacterium]
MIRSTPALQTLLVLLAASAAFPVTAQQTLDRTKVPAPGPQPVLRVPTWTRSPLASGAELIVSQKDDLPLVSFTITFLGGAGQFDAADRRGVGSLTAAMLSEGTTTKTGEELSNALQLLGTNVSTRVGGETASIGFISTSARFGPTLGILADMLLHSTFPADALERLRGQRLVALAQAKAQPGGIADRVFPRVLYGPAHPYGQPVTESSIKAITRADVVAFHQQLFKPGRALVTVAGAVKPAEAKAAIDHALAAWGRGGEKPAFSYPPVPPQQPTTIYLVDRPGAEQATFAIGAPGPPRNTPDYYALEVMNTILGGQFQSRLNANIREEKGYSYGVRSGFSFGKGPGPFRTGGDIVGDKADAALVEFMKELRGIQGARPISDDELATAKSAIVQGLPSMFASVSGINAALSELWVDGLPDDYYQQYGKAIDAVTKDDVVRVATKYIPIDRLAVVIVGDRAALQKPLDATKIAPIVLLDTDGMGVVGR